MEPDNSNVSKPMAAQLLQWIWTEIYPRTVKAGIPRCNMDDLAAIKAWARAIVFGYARRPFDPASSLADRTFQQKLDACRSQMSQLKELRRILAARLDGIRQQVGVAEPADIHRPVLITGIAAFTVAFAPAIFAVFGMITGDAILGWVFSIVVGALVGTYLMLNLLADGHPQKLTSFRWPAIAVGVAFGLLRLSKADDLEGVSIAAGLTVLDVAIVLLAEHYVAKRSEALKHFHESQALRIGAKAALADLDGQIARQEDTEARMLHELQKREADIFDDSDERISEAASATAEAAYRAGVAYIQQLLEGGSPVMDLPQRLPDVSLQGAGR